MDIDVRTVEQGAREPLAAYARLRGYTPGRASFLLESFDHAGAGGRYSVVGYRVRERALMPPGVDALDVQARTLEALDTPESFAAALALGSVGYVSSACASVRHRLMLFEDEGPSGQFAVGSTVVLFDHHERTVTVAGPRQGNLAERCLWELDHEPPAETAPSDKPLAGQEMRALVADAALSGRAARAKSFLGSELASVVLAQTFFGALGGLDLLEVYRALRGRSAGHGYYLDFGQMPGAPDTCVAGVGAHPVHLRRRGDEPRGAVDACRDLFPQPHTVGDPPLTASRVVRKLEESSRQIWGGAVGYLCPGGEAMLVAADEVVTAEQGRLYFTVGTAVDADTEPATVSERARAAAAPTLAAIAAARAPR